jgi:oligopeptidase B
MDIRTAAPALRKIPAVREHHSDRVTDEYLWLSSADEAKVKAHLQAENEYVADDTADLADLETEIFGEITARTPKADLTAVPTLNGGWWLYTRSEEGRQYPMYCRCPQRPGEKLPPSSDDGAALPGEQVLLDGNELASDSGVFAVGTFRISPDGRRLVYSLDSDGDERFTLHIKDLDSGELLADEIPNAYFTCAWTADSSTLLYVTVDAAQRPEKVWRHTVGTPVCDDILVFEERDEQFWLSVSLTRSQRLICIRTSSATTSEVWFLDATSPDSPLRLIRAREPGVYYYVDHQIGADADRLLILHNRNAPNFELAAAFVDEPSKWTPLVAEQPDTRLHGAMAFTDHVVVYFRRGLSVGLRVLGKDRDHDIVFPEEIHTVAPASNPVYDTARFRLTYTSPITPESVYECDMDSGSLSLLRRRPVLPLPHQTDYSPSDYAVHREWAIAPDGTRIPITIVFAADRIRNHAGPCVLYGYGSYERAADMGFSLLRLSLLDRGFSYAVAHVRGGGDLGSAWHDAGKVLRKKNSIDDYLACAQHLVDGGWTTPRGLVARGSSAGGMLVAAALNEKPDAFGAVVARVPFVDPLTAMLDPSLPLTIAERDEWGDPLNDPQVYEYMKSYSPYENVRCDVYPPVLALASLNDTRVRYHEAAKWIARLRDRSAGGPFLLKTDLAAGHRGRSGRYDSWRQEAWILAWIIRTVGI